MIPLSTLAWWVRTLANSFAMYLRHANRVIWLGQSWKWPINPTSCLLSWQPLISPTGQSCVTNHGFFWTENKICSLHGHGGSSFTYYSKHNADSLVATFFCVLCSKHDNCACMCTSKIWTFLPGFWCPTSHCWRWAGVWFSFNIINSVLLAQISEKNKPFCGFKTLGWGNNRSVGQDSDRR